MSVLVSFSIGTARNRPAPSPSIDRSGGGDDKDPVVTVVTSDEADADTTCKETSASGGSPTSVAVWLVAAAVSAVVRSSSPSTPNATCPDSAASVVQVTVTTVGIAGD